ncbi:hypothetical protein PVAND_003376 [Polypedilum vanderplanki]|uniref:Elongator complex protein 1 n=1 Tax=Polypedilum vanderplanki TaxID=319348 RepID=A0A9J6BTV8_POLVA|nr:hypothetical protein PVAND_003376 [Polypedilum vanderplanki]
MRNLKLIYKRSHKYNGIKAQLMSQHVFDNISYIYDENDKIVKSIDHTTSEIKELCSFDGVIALEYVQINDCLCFATESGEIIIYNFNSNDYEVVGLISDGIETMSWSPDQELVVFITKSYNMILMFSTFDVLVEVSLNAKAEKEFITVGWGKKETQFHGSVGKNARKKEEIEVQNIEQLDKTITCCWRGDGDYFAVNFVGSNGRMFKVFDKEGVMQYVSELCANLQVPIAWKPFGLWIAKPEIYNNKYTITLFERNGLKHNELILPFTPDVEEVIDLCWNQDSDILLIETKCNDLYILYFYTICNYHWYLKQSMTFSNKLIFNWSQNYTESKQLHIIKSNGEYSILKFDFIVNHSSGQSEIDESIVAVIDGKKLLLTNFKSQLVPPPMSSITVSLPNSPNIVSFLHETNTFWDSNSFMTIDSLNLVKLYRCIFTNTVNGKRLVHTELAKEIQIKIPSFINHALWINAHHLLISNGSVLYLYSIDSETLLSELQLEDVICDIIKYENLYIAQILDGTLISIQVTTDNLIISDVEFHKLPELCERVLVTSNSNEKLIYALKNLKKKLYLNGKEIATDVTSFTITNDNDFLLYTTIGELKFIKINQNPEEVIDTRRIERGSRIVTLVKNKSQVIFQLPRGNLETISPRILSLKIIKKHLNVSNYKLAFDLIRKERINLNLIIDVQPQKFLDDMKLFIQQIDNIQWLNLFLTELKNEDITVTMYKYCDNSENVKDSAYSVDHKINYVCEKMLKIFTEVDKKKYLLPSITCYVKNENIENALQLIWDLKKEGGNDKEADDAVKYLLYLIDINVLYNYALGMYDYQLVMFVAQKSQKDPKEFVPFLQELNKLEPLYAKFKIDCHLKRYSKAIEHIAKLCESDESKFDECIDVIKKHNVYEAALNAFINHSKCYQKVCSLFGDYLRMKGKLLDASLMYERGHDYQQALSSARNILDWKRCLILARKSNYGETELNDLAEKLILSLNELGRYLEASELIRKFKPNDKKSLIETLMNAREYSQVLFEIAISGNEDLINSIVKPSLLQHFEITFKSITDDKSSYLTQKQRLLYLRQEKTKRIENPQDDEDEDMFSDTTSINSQTSRNTAKTFRSSKNKRKYERKLFNLKEGNKFEDIALLDSIWKLIHKIISHETQVMIKYMIIAGIEMSMDENAKELQKLYKDLLLTIKHTLDEIWLPEMMSAGKYPDTEEEMELFNLNTSLKNKLCYDLIKPEQRFKPKLNVIDFEMEIFREGLKKKN